MIIGGLNLYPLLCNFIEETTLHRSINRTALSHVWAVGGVVVF